MGKAMLRVAVVMAALLALSTAATADLTVNYEGSFNLPVATGWNDYYAGSLVFVPDKATRPGWNGATVKGPTLVVTYNHYQKTVEFDQLPALAKDAGSLGTANWLTNANGGTYWDGSRLVGDVDSVGTVWDIRGGGSSSTNDGMFRDPFGGHVLGGTSAAVLNADWYSVHPVGGALRKGDGAGGDLITDGSTVGAKFVISQRSNPGDVGAWAGKVTEVTRTGAGENDVTTQHLFQYYGVSDADRHHCVQYVRDLGGEEWFVLWKTQSSAVARTGDDLYLDFYPGTLTGDVQGTPESVNVGAMIVNEGPDWITDYTWIRYVGVDWANSQLYLLEAPQGTTGGHLREARVHVLTIGEAPAPIPEPAGLGLVGLALLVIRKRRS